MPAASINVMSKTIILTVTQQHTLIIPKRHVVDYFDLTELEIAAIHQMLIAMRNRIKNDDLTVKTGFLLNFTALGLLTLEKNWLI